MVSFDTSSYIFYFFSIGDKDYADRSVFKEKWPQVEMQLCLFHVLKNFNGKLHR